MTLTLDISRWRRRRRRILKRFIQHWKSFQRQSPIKKKELHRRKHPPNELKIDDETEFKVKQVLIVFMIVSNSDDVAYNIVCACVASLFDWLFNSCSSGRFLIEIYNKRNKQQIKLYKICIGICFLNFTLSDCGWMAVVGRVWIICMDTLRFVYLLKVCVLMK